MPAPTPVSAFRPPLWLAVAALLISGVIVGFFALFSMGIAHSTALMAIYEIIMAPAFAVGELLGKTNVPDSVVLVCVFLAQVACVWLVLWVAWCVIRLPEHKRRFLHQ